MRPSIPAVTFTIMSLTSKAEILKASAGSGKTFRLAKAFIKLLLLNPLDYHQILALTFTNDAKNEMKSRILKELSSLADEEKTILLSEIEKDFISDKIPLNQAQIYYRSNLALTNLLNDYSRFNVVTLDHFFTQLIRHLARELKLNLGYELDLDTSKALNESIQGLYNSKDIQVKKWLQAFINSKIEEDKGWNIEFNIKNLGYKLFQDSFIDIQQELRANATDLEGFVKQLKESINVYKAAMQTAGKQAMEIIHFHGLTESDFRKYTVSVFIKLGEGKDIDKPFSATFLKGDWATKTSERKDEIEACANDGLHDVHTKIIALAESEKKQAYIEATNLLSNIYSYGVLSALADNLWKYRSDNNLLLLSDTASILNGVISLSDAPFMYEKMGAKFNHIMIDEFQDTSTHQWKNILPLLQYALFENGNLLLVGDVKQSIYRWRGGDANLLLHQAAADLTDHSPLQNALDTNYRSGKNIISFNNAFFTTASQSLTELVEGFADMQDAVTQAYADVEQAFNKSFDGYVKVEFFGGDADYSWKEQAFNTTEETIKQALSDGFNPEDILILVRKNKEAGEVATYLLSKGIHTITDEALQLEKSPLVQFLINSLQLISAPNSTLALANVNYFYNLINDKSASQSLENLLENSSLTEFSKNLTAYEAIEKLIEDYGLYNQFDPFLQGLQDLSLSLGQQGHASIAGFVNRWNELHQDNKSKPSIILGKPKDAVQVKTIHKSKGLESPVVIVPQINGSFYNPQHVFWPTDLPDKYKKWASLPLRLTSKLNDTSFAPNYVTERFEIALEEINTLYVAFTRAVERLYVFVQDKKAKDSAQHVLKSVLSNSAFSFSGNFNQEIFELGTLENAEARNENTTEDNPLQTYPLSSPTLKLALTKDKDFWKQLNTDKANHIREGIIIHAIMAQLKVFNLPELAPELTKIIRLMMLNGKIIETQTSHYSTKIIELFNKLPALHQWFAPGWEVINERKILAKGHTHIPDRVVIKANNAVIIDFKKELKSEKYKDQIRNYARLLTEMGYNVIGMHLVYIDLFEMEEVS